MPNFKEPVLFKNFNKAKYSFNPDIRDPGSAGGGPGINEFLSVKYDNFNGVFIQLPEMKVISINTNPDPEWKKKNPARNFKQNTILGVSENQRQPLIEFYDKLNTGFFDFLKDNPKTYQALIKSTNLVKEPAAFSILQEGHISNLKFRMKRNEKNEPVMEGDKYIFDYNAPYVSLNTSMTEVGEGKFKYNFPVFDNEGNYLEYDDVRCFRGHCLTFIVQLTSIWIAKNDKAYSGYTMIPVKARACRSSGTQDEAMNVTPEEMDALVKRRDESDD